MTTPDILTAAEVAALLHVSERHVFECARDGRLPCVRLGRSVRFSRQRIEALFAAPCRVELERARELVAR